VKHRNFFFSICKELILALKNKTVGEIRIIEKPLSAPEYMDTMMKAKQICAGQEITLNTLASNKNYDLAELRTFCNVELLPKINGFLEKLFIERRST
jgi:hypothetical protein